MQTIQLKLTGTRGLLMNSDKMADPLNPLTKAHKLLTGKRKKTDDDYEEIAKSEFIGSMYIDEAGPYIPGINVEAALVAGGKLSKLGTQLKRSVEVMDECCYLLYDGPNEIEAMWDAGMYDSRSVKIGQAKLIRYRPFFKEWSLICEIMYDETSIDREQIINCMMDAGKYCGLGDYRPKFGRFNIEEI